MKPVEVLPTEIWTLLGSIAAAVSTAHPDIWYHPEMTYGSGSMYRVGGGGAGTMTVRSLVPAALVIVM